MLTEAQRRRFADDGFLVLPGFVPPAECRRLMDRARRLVEGFDPGPSLPVFTTSEQARTSDEYFLGSGRAVRFFFEEGALDADGCLVHAKELAINKIGHALHDLDPTFDRFSRDRRLAALAAALDLRHPLLVQSMYIFKQPRIGGEVTLHTDHTFLWTDPPSVTGFWFALEDATVHNGCLWALPGGHHLPVKRRFRRAPGGGTTFDVLDGTPYPRAGEVPLEVEQGGLVVLHGLLPHRSGPNLSDRSRHAYTLHVIEADAAYPGDNWLDPSAGPPLRGFA